MSDFLERLTQRIFGLQRDLLPRRRLPYEPDPEGPLFQETVEERDEQITVGTPRTRTVESDAQIVQRQIGPAIEIHLESVQPAGKHLEDERPVIRKPGIALAESQVVPSGSHTNGRPDFPLSVEKEDLKVIQPSDPSAMPVEQTRSNFLSELPAFPGKQTFNPPASASVPDPVRLSPPNPQGAPGVTAESKAGVVQVTIGRIEVRLSQPAPQPTRSGSRPQPPKVGLSEYLQRRDRGQS